MNYRHAFHAGNFADVIKHLALVAILDHLRKKEAGFAVIDTHAGRGLYDLASDEARRGGEWQAGIGRLRNHDDGPELVRRYRAIADSFGLACYPGSPLIAASLLRPQDRLLAIEKQPEEFEALRRTLAPFKRARAIAADGYVRLPALLPPKERRGLVLIDPPYESPDEFPAVARAVKTVLTRFATGIVLIWFPVKSAAEADSFCGEVNAQGAKKLLRLNFVVDAAGGRLNAAGLLIVNPPFGFAHEMAQALEHIAPLLGRSDPARVRLEWLAGSQ